MLAVDKILMTWYIKASNQELYHYQSSQDSSLQLR